MVRTALASGLLVQTRRSVVVAAACWPDKPEQQHVVRARAEAAANPGAVLSHQSAALVWGLPTPGFESWATMPASVVLAPAGHTSHSSGAVHHIQALDPAFVRRDKRGYLLTSPARTAVDLAAPRDLPGQLVLLDGAARVIIASMVGEVRRWHYTNERLVRGARELLSEAASSIRTKSLDEALGLLCPGRESAPESLSAAHIYRAGLPMPVFQGEIRTPAGIFYADCLWEEQKLVGECDGAVKYTDPSAIVKEKVRERWVLDEGYRFVRWMATEAVLQPVGMTDRIGRALGL